MDPSTTVPQTQPVAKVQPPETSLRDLASGTPPAQQPPKQQMISGHPEQGPIQAAPAVEAPQDTEEVVQPAKQENSAQAAPQASVEVQQVEIQPSVPEVQVEQSVEAVVEKSPDTEKPDLPDAVKQAGVTFSGPGIPVEENAFAIKTMPVSYEEAVKEEKATKIKDSKHWLMAKIIYIWRKINPDIGKKGAQTQNVSSTNS